jgi:hypothetical protein
MACASVVDFGAEFQEYGYLFRGCSECLRMWQFVSDGRPLRLESSVAARVSADTRTPPTFKAPLGHVSVFVKRST